MNAKLTVIHPSTETPGIVTTVERRLRASNARHAQAAIVASIFDYPIPTDGDPDDREEIDVNAGMAAVIDASISALVDTGLVFDRGGILVALDRDNSVHQLSAQTIRFALARLIRYVKTSMDKRGNIITEPAPCPAYVGDTIAAMSKWPGMPIVNAIVDHPVIDDRNEPIGSGYNAKHRIFCRLTGENQHRIPTSAPTKGEAADALELLLGLLTTFDFEEADDQAATICAMLQAAARPVLSCAPMILIDAPTPGSGKGELGGVIARIASDYEHPGKRLAGKEEEIAKGILASLLGGKPVIYFDEVCESEIDSPSLRTLATNSTIEERLLGVSKNVTVSTNTLIVLNGNNIAATADMARRILPIRLNPKCENPSLRRFKQSPRRMMIDDRSKYLHALLTIQRAYLASDRVAMETKVGGFPEWETLCRQPVYWLTGQDPAAKMIRAMSENPAKAGLLAVLQEWHNMFGETPTAVSAALESPAFAFAMSGLVPRKPGTPINAINFGKFIQRHRDQIVQGYRLDLASSAGGKNHWRVVKGSG